MNRERWCIACSDFFFSVSYYTRTYSIFFCVHSMDPKYSIIFDRDDNDNDIYALLCRDVKVLGKIGVSYRQFDNAMAQVKDDHSHF